MPRRPEIPLLQVTLFLVCLIGKLPLSSIIVAHALCFGNDHHKAHQRHHCVNPPCQQESSLSPLMMSPSGNSNREEQASTRRSLLHKTTSMVAASLLVLLVPSTSPANAKPDCFQDCLKNCKQVVPNDTSDYCRSTCLDYCEQPDRRDGLSGSVSSEGGEVGILGGTFGQGTVVKGEDKPPSIKLPGLNFNSNEGRKLLGLED